MKKNKKSLLVICILLLVLVSCTISAGYSKSQDANKQWLQDLSCSFPCWQNITPQKTIFEDVIPILRDAKIITHSAAESEISFVFDENIYGSIGKASNGMVDNIILDVHYKALSVSDLEKVIDTPTSVSLAQDYSGDCIADLLYPNYGTILEIAGLKNDSKNKNKLECQVEITVDSHIFRIILMSANFYNSEFWNHSSYASLDYMDWKGYGTYP